MKKIFLVAFTALLAYGFTGVGYNPAIKSYVEFLETGSNYQTGVDYMLSLYDNYDIVVWGEREHAEMEQYYFLKKLISSEKFINEVGDIYIEVGGSHLKQRFDELVLGEIPRDSLELGRKITALQRDATFHVIWSKYSYYYFLYTVCEINRDLPMNKKIRIFPVDVPLDWSEIDSKEEYNEKSSMMVRDSIMAANTVNFYKNSGREKALVIMNTIHSQNKVSQIPGVGNWFMSYFVSSIGKPIANVLVNTSTIPLWDYSKSNGLISDGKWEAAFISQNIDEAGFNFDGSPFGEDNFDFNVDIETDLKYKDVYTGMIYLPLAKRLSIFGFPGLVDPESRPEIARRFSILGSSVTSEMIDEYFNQQAAVLHGFEDLSEEDEETILDRSELRDRINQWLK